MIRRFPLLFFFLIAFYLDINAQCPAILTDDPIEVCSSGGTVANIETVGIILSAHWAPNIGLNDANILNPTFLAPTDTTYLLTITGIDAETKDTCLVQKKIAVKVAIFDLTITLDTLELPCGDTIRLSADVRPNGSFFIIEWETTNGHFTRGNQTLTPLIDAVGQYNANVIGTLGRIVCRDKDSVQVVLKGDELNIIPPEILHCNQSATTLTIADQVDSTTYLYNWTTSNGQILGDQDDLSVQVAQSGIYEVTRTDLFGDCEVSAMVEVLEEPSFENFDIDLNEPNCDQSGSLIVTNLKGGAAPYLFSVDGGLSFQDSPSFDNLLGKDYSVLVKDQNGCEVSKAISFTPFSRVELSLIPFQEVENRTDFQIPLLLTDNGANIQSIQWWPNVGLSCVDCLNPTLTAFKNRRYEVTVIDDKGCEEKAKIEIAIRQPSLFYTPTVFSPNADRQNDEFAIFLNTKFVKQLKNMTIFDRYGNLIIQQSVPTGTAEVIIWNGQYKGKDMPVGTYLYAGELELLDGATEQFSGTLNLIR